MTWVEYAAARQHQVEHRIGTRIREARAIEEAQARKAKKALSR